MLCLWCYILCWIVFGNTSPAFWRICKSVVWYFLFLWCAYTGCGIKDALIKWKATNMYLCTMILNNFIGYIHLDVLLWTNGRFRYNGSENNNPICQASLDVGRLNWNLSTRTKHCILLLSVTHLLFGRELNYYLLLSFDFYWMTIIPYLA